MIDWFHKQFQLFCRCQFFCLINTEMYRLPLPLSLFFATTTTTNCLKKLVHVLMYWLLKWSGLMSGRRHQHKKQIYSIKIQKCHFCKKWIDDVNKKQTFYFNHIFELDLFLVKYLSKLLLLIFLNSNKFYFKIILYY